MLLLCLSLVCCDSGDIYPEQKRVEEVEVRVEARFDFENMQAFPQNYRIVWGAFVGTSPYPLAFEVATKPATGTWQAATLQTVPRGTTHMALALLDRVEDKARYFFHRVPLGGDGELTVDGTVDLAPFARVQAQIFTPQCIQCHGAGGLAAGLDLTEGNARANLVDAPSQPDNSPKMRVEKYSLQNSFLLDVLTLRPATITTNHTTLSSLDAVDDIELIRAWITSPND